MQTENLGGKRYVLVVVDDFFRYTWVRFLREKSKAFVHFQDWFYKFNVRKIFNVKRFRSDHGKKFENVHFATFCTIVGIHHEFFTPINPQQNGVVERKNRTLQKWPLQCCMLSIYLFIWAEALNIVCYIHNRVVFRPGTTNTIYEIWGGGDPMSSTFMCLVARATFL